MPPLTIVTWRESVDVPGWTDSEESDAEDIVPLRDGMETVDLISTASGPAPHMAGGGKRGGPEEQEGGGDARGDGLVEMRLEEAEEADNLMRCCGGVPVYVVLCVLMCVTSSALLGYDIGIMSAAKLPIRTVLRLSDEQTELMVGILNVVSAFGGLFSGKISDRYGRKKTIGGACVTFITGALMMAAASDFTVLIVGRVITGLGVGAGMMVAPLYSAELSPKRYRGALVSFSEVAINVGILAGYLGGFLFGQLGDDVSWRWMLGVGALPPFMILLGLMILPESPRWLVEQGRSGQALHVLKRTCGLEEGYQMLEALEKEQEEGEGLDLRAACGELLQPGPGLRSMLIIGLGAAVFQQVSGVEAAVYYTPEMLKEAGIEDQDRQLVFTVIIGFIKVVFIFIPMLLLDRAGRKVLLQASAAGMALAQFLIGLNFSGASSPALAIGAQALYFASFSVGYGPVAWVVSAEVFPLRVRGLAMGIATFVNRVTSGIIAISFLSLQRLLTPAGTFYMFSGFCLLAFVFSTAVIPETKGKSLEEIEADLTAHPLRIARLCDRGPRRRSSRGRSAKYHELGTTDTDETEL